MIQINKERYNLKYLKKIINMMVENRFEEAISEWYKYIEGYPEDLDGYSYCADCYMSIGDFESANKLLEKGIIVSRIREQSKEQHIFFKIKLLSCQGKYIECLKLVKENVSMFKKNDWNYYSTLIYLKKQLGILECNDYEFVKGHYLLSQIVSYDEDLAIEHIKKHIYSDNNNNEFLFDDKFPLSDIYYKLRKEGLLLENKNKIYNSAICNEHIFKYEANGHIGSKLVDYFLVITLKDTNEVITMCPYDNIGRVECIDLTPVVKESPNQKRLTQIEKFNLKYQKNS